MDLYKREFLTEAKKSEQNLRISIIAGLSFKDLRDQLIGNFEKKLRLSLDENGWAEAKECEVSKSWKDGYWAKFRKARWPKHIYIGIGPSSNFSRHDLAVIAPDKEIEFDKNTRQLIAGRLVKKMGNGSGNVYSVWSQCLLTNYSDLNSADGLVAISEFQNHESVIDLAERIKSIGSSLDAIFNELNLFLPMQ